MEELNISNVESIQAGHLASLHFQMCSICIGPKREKMKAQSEESRNDLCWLQELVKRMAVLGCEEPMH